MSNFVIPATNRRFHKTCDSRIYMKYIERLKNCDNAGNSNFTTPYKFDVSPYPRYRIKPSCAVDATRTPSRV